MTHMVDEIMMSEELSNYAKEQALEGSQPDESKTVIQTLTVISMLKVIVLIAVGFIVCK